MTSFVIFEKWFAFIYPDDILSCFKDLAEHEQHVRKVLQMLLENQLYIGAKKKKKV